MPESCSAYRPYGHCARSVERRAGAGAGGGGSGGDSAVRARRRWARDVRSRACQTHHLGRVLALRECLRERLGGKLVAEPGHVDQPALLARERRAWGDGADVADGVRRLRLRRVVRRRAAALRRRAVVVVLATVLRMELVLRRVRRCRHQNGVGGGEGVGDWGVRGTTKRPSPTRPVPLLWREGGEGRLEAGVETRRCVGVLRNLLRESHATHVQASSLRRLPRRSRVFITAGAARGSSTRRWTRCRTRRRRGQ